MFDWLDELKTSFEKYIGLGISKFILNAMGQNFESEVSESARPLQLIQDFHPLNTQVVLDEGITIEENFWKVECDGEGKKVLVFEYPEINPSECLLVFQVKVKAVHSNQKIGVCFKGCGFRGLPGTYTRVKAIEKGWSIYEFPFNYWNNQFSQNFTFELQFQGEGLFLVKYVKIFQAPIQPAFN
ncbi:MAG: hypothetical protein SWZ49_09070 [Cyanobacteriota bacterium]|nr:hypothetical protein [Cyanobacteriota bacterium]